MTLFDVFTLAVVGLSIMLGMMRGFVREVFALLGWIVAFMVANQLASPLSQFLPASISAPTIRLLGGFIAAFGLSLLIMSLITKVLSELIKLIGLGGFDKILGGVFGCLRGVVIMVILVIISGLTSLPKQEGWRNAMFSSPLEALAIKVLPSLPDTLRNHVQFD